MKYIFIILIEKKYSHNAVEMITVHQKLNHLIYENLHTKRRADSMVKSNAWFHFSTLELEPWGYRTQGISTLEARTFRHDRKEWQLSIYVYNRCEPAV